jgi:nitrous oxide reductase accessory protein NosL
MRFIPLLAVIVLLLSPMSAKSFDKKASTSNAQIIQEGKGKEFCPVCGMKLKMFYKTNHAVKLKDGIKKQYCSMRCLAHDLDAIETRIDTILVADAQTEKMIQAKDAHYVYGSKAPGTMSMQSKYAFASPDHAKQFMQNFGGELMDFDTAFAKAKETLKKDVAMVQKKKDRKMYPMGKKMYNMKCEDVDTSRYTSINEMKGAMASYGTCEGLNPKQFQAVALYLWEVKRFAHGHAAKIDVPDGAKCPVCGMFVSKYPKWAAVISHDGHNHYFDGAKDMFKFYFEPKAYSGHNLGEDVSIYVTDYYTLEAVKAIDAFYVIGSSVTGPMGHEFVPFKNKNAATEFKNDYNGKKVLSFDEVSKGDAEKLDHGDFDL